MVARSNTPLQSEAGYIDARPKIRSTKLLATHGRTIHGGGMRRCFPMLAIAVLAGCASSGPTGREILTGSIAPSASRLVIYRTSALGLAVQPDYTIDSQKG